MHNMPRNVTVACAQLVFANFKLHFEVRDNILQRCQIAGRERERERERLTGQMLQSATYRCTLLAAHGTWAHGGRNNHNKFQLSFAFCATAQITNIAPPQTPLPVLPVKGGSREKWEGERELHELCALTHTHSHSHSHTLLLLSHLNALCVHVVEPPRQTHFSHTHTQRHTHTHTLKCGNNADAALWLWQRANVLSAVCLLSLCF